METLSYKETSVNPLHSVPFNSRLGGLPDYPDNSKDGGGRKRLYRAHATPPHTIAATGQLNNYAQVREPETRKQPRIPLVGSLTQSHKSNYELPQAWAEYLSQFNPWSWYGHFTFRDYPHPESANKAWNLFTHKLNRKIFGVKYWKHPERGVTWARGTELQGRGAIHFHAILGRIPKDVRRLAWMDEWYELGGISRIFPYEENRGAEYYMSKSTYAWKRGEVDLGGPLSQTSLTL